MKSGKSQRAVFFTRSVERYYLERSYCVLEGWRAGELEGCRAGGLEGQLHVQGGMAASIYLRPMEARRRDKRAQTGSGSKHGATPRHATPRRAWMKIHPQRCTVV